MSGDKEFFLDRFSHWIEHTLSRFFYRLGKVISAHPWLFVVLPCILMFGFFLRVITPGVTEETDPEDLYTPQDSVSFAERLVVENGFGYPNTTNRLFLKRVDGKNILDRSNTNDENKVGLKALLTAYRQMADIEVDGMTLANRCSRVFLADDNTTVSACDTISVLSLFSPGSSFTDDSVPADFAAIELAIDNSANVMDDIVTGLSADPARNAVNKAMFKSDLFGKPLPVSDTDFTLNSAATLVLAFTLINFDTRVNGDFVKDQARLDFEREASKQIRALDSKTFVYAPLFEGDSDFVASQALSGDIALLGPGYFLLLIYATYVFWRRNWVYSYSSMALVAVGAVGFAILGMWGFGVLIGTTYSATVNVAFFLLMGLGADDAFVIMAAHRDVPRTFDAKERVARALSRAGVSITITSVTDVVAFAAGTNTALPAIEYFCTYAAFGVLFDFFLQCTVFVAFLYWNTRREEEGKADWLFCWKPSDGDKTCCTKKEDNVKYDPDQLCLLDRIMGEYLPNYLLHPIGKAAVLVFAIALVSSSAWASTQTKSRFNIEWFIPDSSFINDGLDIQRAEFGGTPQGFGLYTGGQSNGELFVDYTTSDTQTALDTLISDTLESEYVRDCANAWWPAYKEFLQDTSVPGLTPQGHLLGNDFYTQLDNFLATSGSRFKGNIQREESGLGLIVLSAQRCTLEDVFESDSQVEAMNAIRDLADKHPELGGDIYETARGTVKLPFGYDYVFLFSDGLAVIQQETIRNIIIAGIAVAVVTLILLANIAASAIVLLMLTMVDINVLGFMYYADVDFNSVSAVNLVIAVGLAIDSSVHIAHAFLNAQGTRDERAKEAMRVLGRSVTNGAVSTFLAIVLLAAAESYVFQVFFTLLALIIVFAFFHGAIVLPVVLSLIGPDAHPPKSGFEDEMDKASQEEGLKPTTSTTFIV
eukprot:m.252050 g.252050  ORF g.252050 m.252050 type:complete len:932 (-) comp17525_c0_seq6:1882-4677(-)